MTDLLYEASDAVATLTLNRPDRLNTISPAMLEELSTRLIEADQNREIRAIVITGAGRAFCAGLDLQEATDGTGIGSNTEAMGQHFDLRNAPPVVLHKIDTPTLCALNGAAAGYGLDMALGCDIRVAAQSSKLAPAFTRRGILPESGGTWLLPRLLGWAKAAEIVFTGRTLLADECLELGLVNRVVPDDEVQSATRAVALEVASNAPLAVQASKRMMRSGLSEPFEEHVHHVYLQLLPLFRSQDFREGIQAFMEKRDPSFEGR